MTISWQHFWQNIIHRVHLTTYDDINYILILAGMPPQFIAILTHWQDYKEYYISCGLYWLSNISFPNSLPGLPDPGTDKKAPLYMYGWAALRRLATPPLRGLEL